MAANKKDPRPATMTTLLDVVLRIRRPLSILLHTALIVTSNAAAFWLRFDGEVPDHYVAMGLRMLPWLVAVRLLSLWRFRLFEGLWRYTSLWDLRNIIYSVVVSTAAFVLIVLVASSPDRRYPLSIYIFDAILLLCAMTAVRLSRRLHRELTRPARKRRVLVYGAGDAGEMIVRDMRQNDAFDAEPIGFIDDDARKVGERIHGIPVFGTREGLLRIVERHQPDDVLLAMPGLGRERLRQIVKDLECHPVRLTTLPRTSGRIGDHAAVNQIRQLRIEDLLTRDPVDLDYAPVRRFLAGKRVLVTGAGGSIGSELCRQIGNADPAGLFLLDRYENGLFQIYHEIADRTDAPVLRSIVADVTDSRRIAHVLTDVRPDIIFHAAAHKHVPLMEANPCEAVKNNVRGTRIVAEAALRCGVERFVMISTDKAVNPTSVMGATKRVAELIVARLNTQNATRFATVRFGNVLGSNGSVIPRFLGQIATGGPVTVTHPEIRRYFMLIPEAVQLVLHAASLDDGAPVYLLEMGEQIKVSEMARTLIRLAGLVPDKDIAVEYTGLRPGEKMFEELVGEGELAEPSSMPKVMRLKSAHSASPSHSFAAAIERLEVLAVDGRAEETVRELCSIVPNFMPTTLPIVVTI